VNIRAEPGAAVVRIAGEAGVGQVDELTAALLRVSAWRPPLVTLDLNGLTFISCLAVGALAQFRHGLVRAWSRVRLAPILDQPVRELLERAGLLARFEPAEDLHEPDAARHDRRSQAKKPSRSVLGTRRRAE
jgi:anti-anti-sigma factor